MLYLFFIKDWNAQNLTVSIDSPTFDKTYFSHVCLLSESLIPSLLFKASDVSRSNTDMATTKYYLLGYMQSLGVSMSPLSDSPLYLSELSINV